MTDVVVGPAPERVLVASRRRAFVIAAVLALAALVIALLVSAHTVPAPIRNLDDWARRALRSAEGTPLVTLARVLAYIGSVPVQLVVGAGAAVSLALGRRFRAVVLVALACGAGQGAAVVVKHSVDRARPDHALALAHASGSSYPSGHVVGAAVTAGVLLLAFVPVGPRRRVWGAVAVGWVVLMAASRLVLRVHWLSDTIGAALLGTAVVLASAATAELLPLPARLAGQPRNGTAASVR